MLPWYRVLKTGRLCCVQVPVVRPQLHERSVRHHGPVRVRPSRGRLHPAGRLQVNGVYSKYGCFVYVSRGRCGRPVVHTSHYILET